MITAKKAYETWLKRERVAKQKAEHRERVEVKKIELRGGKTIMGNTATIAGLYGSLVRLRESSGDSKERIVLRVGVDEALRDDNFLLGNDA